MIERIEGQYVVRDDMLFGGTKARFTELAFKGVDELVYATPQEGGAQTALAFTARRLGKKLTLFVAERKQRHERVELSIALGAQVIEVKPGFLSHVQDRAERYAASPKLFRTNYTARYLRFGLFSEQIIEVIAQAARLIPPPRALVFAAGSGTLAQGLGRAWPAVPRVAVQVGHRLTPREVAGARIVIADTKFSKPELFPVPFPADPHYEVKAWKWLMESGKQGVTFWNVAGSAQYYRLQLDGLPTDNEK